MYDFSWEENSQSLNLKIAIEDDKELDAWTYGHYHKGAKYGLSPLESQPQTQGCRSSDTRGS